MKQSTKKIAAMVGGVVMFFGTIAPLAAQDNQPARAPYNPRVGDSATATVLNTWEGHSIVGKQHDIIIIDVDGDGRTTDDQRMMILQSDNVKNNPQRIFKKGDKLLYIENEGSIIYKRVYEQNTQRVH
jgi:hypothetical protein